MSTRVESWAWDQPGLLPQQKLVLLRLAVRATDNGVCFPGQAEIRGKTGLGETMVRRHVRALASTKDKQGQPRAPLLDIIERPVSRDRNTSNVYVLRVPWARPEAVGRELTALKHVPPDACTELLRKQAVAGDAQETEGTAAADSKRPIRPSVGVAGDPQEGLVHDPGEWSLREHHWKTPPAPPTTEPRGQQQGGHVEPTETICPSPPAPGSVNAGDSAARVLAEALYRGLGTQLEQLTPALRRRELAIAGQLVDVGATPTEAEAYARDARSHAGRIAAVDVRSYERERLSWNARRQTERQATVHRVDRTGEPPRGVHAGSIARALFGAKP